MPMGSNNDSSIQRPRRKGSCESQGEDAPSTESSGKASRGLWWAAGVASLVLVALLVGSYWLLIGGFGLSAESLFVRSGGGIATALAAAMAAFLLYYRWTVEHPIQVKQEQDRLNAQDRLERERLDVQARLHRQQQRGTRQESLGERMAKAIDHLGENNSYTQVAGLIELATLVDDWWSLGEEMLADLTGDDTTQERHRIEGLIQRRRQELVDLIFKNTPTPEQPTATDGTEDTSERKEMLSAARSQILRSHLASVKVRSGSPDYHDEPHDPDSWRHLNLDGAQLQGADLTLKHLSEAQLNNAQLEWALLGSAKLDKAELINANLKKAHLISTRLNNSVMFYADLKGTYLQGARLEGADLRSDNLDSHYQGRPSFDDKTNWPDNYDPIESGFVRSDEDNS